jgi:hypothetical protein
MLKPHRLPLRRRHQQHDEGDAVQVRLLIYCWSFAHVVAVPRRLESSQRNRTLLWFADAQLLKHRRNLKYGYGDAQHNDSINC